MTNLRILVVEDDIVLKMFYKKIFKQTPHDLIGVVRTGEEAVEKARNESPDLILMDIMLDGPMNGIEAAFEIKEFMEVPIVYCSAYTDGESIEKAKETNPKGFLSKPIHIDQLFGLVDEIATAGSFATKGK